MASLCLSTTRPSRKRRRRRRRAAPPPQRCGALGSEPVLRHSARLPSEEHAALGSAHPGFTPSPLFFPCGSSRAAARRLATFAPPPAPVRGASAWPAGRPRKGGSGWGEGTMPLNAKRWAGPRYIAARQTHAQRGAGLGGRSSPRRAARSAALHSPSGPRAACLERRLLPLATMHSSACPEGRLWGRSVFASPPRATFAVPAGPRGRLGPFGRFTRAKMHPARSSPSPSPAWHFVCHERREAKLTPRPPFLRALLKRDFVLCNRGVRVLHRGKREPQRAAFAPAPPLAACLHSAYPERKFLSVFVNDKLINNSSTQPVPAGPSPRQQPLPRALIGWARECIH